MDRPASRSDRPLLKMAPKMATPTEPPMERKKLTVEVALPRSAAGTEFWVARIKVCSVRPIPTPRTTM
jgi:hypothetical protein